MVKIQSINNIRSIQPGDTFFQVVNGEVIEISYLDALYFYSHGVGIQ